jgi:Ca2+-binding RTX toxin-like protein
MPSASTLSTSKDFSCMTTTCFSTSVSTMAMLRQQIVFIDAHVNDHQMLANTVLPTVEVVMLDPQLDGIQQISEVLATRIEIDSVHIVSHGTPGCLYIGNSQLSLSNISHYAESLQSWFTSRSLTPQLSIYGCNVAAGDAGEEFIAKLQQLTNAEIAASTTLIGNRMQGGNWNLDFNTHEAFTPIFSELSLAAYPHTLNTTRSGTAGNDVFNDPGINLNFVGGAGNDTYGIYNSTAIIIENANEGTDTVWSEIDYTLTANVENLYLVGAVSGTGNDKNNIITGYGAGENIIFGLGGNDTLNGGASHDSLNGGTGSDYLSGGAGDDILDDSEDGLDTLAGGADNDVYTINNSATKIVENANEGTDTVWSAVDYTLAANVENMYLVGAVSGTGNDKNNIITGYGAGENIIFGLGGNDTLDGGAGHDSLNGGTGSDYLSGGAGDDILDDSEDGLDTLAGGADNDVYTINNSATKIVENANEGTDTVWSAVNYTLTANVENMYLTGATTGTGNDKNNIITGYGAGDNTINGLGGNDYLDGGAGNNTLSGGVGVDTFVLSAPNSGLNTVTDFATSEFLKVSSFTSLSGLTVRAGAGLSTATAANQFILNSSNGSLYFDADGLGGSNAVKIATLQGATNLTVANFV